MGIIKSKDMVRMRAPSSSSPMAMFSVHPEFAEKILDGSKQVEYRRKIYDLRHCNPRRTGWGKGFISKILIYATSPICKVLGQANVSEVVAGSPEFVWQLTSDVGAITQDRYNEYFRDCFFAYGILLKRPIRYQSPLELKCFGVDRAPQNFCYITQETYLDVMSNYEPEIYSDILETKHLCIRMR